MCTKPRTRLPNKGPVAKPRTKQSTKVANATLETRPPNEANAEAK